MANPTTKFVSVNLNKSYGRSQPQPSSSSSSSSSTLSSRFGNGSRGRAGSGGMVLLPRPWSSGHKVGGRLSVPPPLNLPSLKKEHERQGPSTGLGSLAEVGGGGFGAGHASAGVGWSKPVAQGKDGGGVQTVRPGYDPSAGGGSGYATSVPADQSLGDIGRAAVLRGEDFPSLDATRYVSPQKVVPGQRQMQRSAGEEASDGKAGRTADLRGSPPPMRSQLSSACVVSDEKLSAGENDSRLVLAGSQRNDDGLLTSPLPVVRLMHTSDWADDERDTSHVISDRSREKGFSRNEYGKGSSYLNGRSGNDPDVGSSSTRQLYSVESYARDLFISGCDGTSWRASQVSRDGILARGSVVRDFPGNYKSSLPRDRIREVGKQGQLMHMGGDESFGGTQDLCQSLRGSGNGKTTQIAWNEPESCNLRTFQQNENAHHRYADGLSNKYKSNNPQKDLVSRVRYSVGSKGPHMNESVLNFSADKCFLNSGKPYMVGPSLHSIDPFSNDIDLKGFRRKKDSPKQAAFYDPVRDSFEAELEEVQRTQEKERQYVFEEKMQALELARKVEEERERIVREENERRTREGDETRGAMQREEQERLETSKKELEVKIAREEEKRKILAEEERRKEAARRKLLELEARIVRRQAEAAAKDDSPAGIHVVKTFRGTKEGEISRGAGGGDWEDGDGMVERITSSASSDSSGLNRGFVSESRPSSKDGNTLFMGRPKQVNSWKNDSYDNVNSSTLQENGYQSQRHDAFGMGRTLSRKGFFDSTEAALGRTSSKEGISEFHHTRGHGWGSSGNVDLYHRNSDFGNAFLENDNYSSGAGWEQARQHASPHSPYSDNLFHSSETDTFNSFGRSRHFTRQPRVLPPLSFSSVPKGSFRAVTEQPTSSTYIENGTRDHSANRSDEKNIQGAYKKEQERSWQLGTASVPLDSPSVEEDETNAEHYDSQSSVSVTSPTISPVHLSYDDLEQSRDFSALSASKNNRYGPSDSAHALSVPDTGISEIVTDSSSVSPRVEDEWTIENNDEMQDLEEYDEYGDPEEVRPSDCENLGITQHFENLQLSVQDKSIENDQMVLGFNEGIQIKIPDNDEFEGCSRGEGAINKQMVAGAVLDLGSFDGLADERGSTSHSKDSTFPDVTRNSPDTLDDTKQVLQNFVIEPVTSISASNNPEALISTEFPPKHQVESALPSQSSLPTTILSDSAVPSQTNASMELQFGLFSGPSLIPSPVPAIQIGSIQMPLHLHPPVGQPIPPMQSSQPTFLEFGQLHFPSPIAQGIFPLTPQNMPFVRSSVPPLNNFNEDVGRVLHNHDEGSRSSLQNMQTKEKVVGSSRKAFDVPQQIVKAEKPNLLHDDQLGDNLESNNQKTGHYDDKREMENERAQKTIVHYDDKQKMENEKAKSATSIISSQLVSGGLSFIQSEAPHKIPTERGKMYVYTRKNARSRPQFSGMAEALRANHNSLRRKASRHIQRTEFRVRESGVRKHGGLDLLNYTSHCEKLGFNRVPGGSIRNLSKRTKYVSKSTKSALETQNITMGSSSLQFIIPECKTTGGEVASKQVMPSVSSCHTRDGRLKSYGISEKVVDAPLQCGIVQIFKQPGIEIPSDEDDFIEVRSKRQMLKNRREQKEKEMKAKSRAFKQAFRKNFSISWSTKAFPSLNKENISVRGHLLSSSGSFGDGGTGVANCATSTVCSADLLSQPELDRGTYVCRINTSSDSWNDGHVSQQVMPLTQTRLDDAMKPAEFDTHATSISNRTSITGDQGSLSAAAVDTDKTSSIALSSLLSAEKIQFGAITTPAILPPVSRAVPVAIGPPSSTSCMSDVSAECNLTASDHDSTIFFEKGKCLDESGAHLEDQDAEAAASAVAVAAISNDEAARNGLAACSVSTPESNKIGGAGSNLQEVRSHSTGEESLTVMLPADLSVETPSLSSWPVFPGSQSSTALLSHFPGASSHCPLFDMNSMLGGPVFAIGSHDESAGSQSQPPKSMQLGSGSPGNWPQCLSAVESFYGPPAGFPVPFINPQGEIPGIQVPPQMLFYNPFAPQYSLSIMGASAFVPPRKQPDWKHNPVSSVTDVTESDANNHNAIAGQQNSPNMPSPIHHLGQISPLLSMASHLPIFDMSSFQSSTDIPVQAQWPRLSGAPLNSVPMSVQSEQQHVNRVSTQVVSHCLPVDSSTSNSRIPESCTRATVDGNRNLGTSAVLAAQFPHEQVTTETTATDTACILPKEVSCGSSSGENEDSRSRGIVVNSCETFNIASLTSNIRTTSNRGSVVKTRMPTPSASHQHRPPDGQADHRGCTASQKTGSGNEWHRRTGLQRKCRALADRNFSSIKLKQIYVAKQPAASMVRTREI